MSPNAFEQFIYNTEGLVVSTTGASPGVTVHGEDVQSNLRYLWRGGRDDGDGLLMMPGGGEQDTHRGTPLGDDAYAYQRYVSGGFFDSENVEWTVVQERSADAGTQGTWSVPSTWGAWTDFSGKYAAFRPSAEWNADRYHIAQVAGWVSTAAFTAATFGQYTAVLGLAKGALAFAGMASVGAGVGGTYSYAQGGSAGDIASSAFTGAQLSTAIGAFSPRTAAWALERTAMPVTSTARGLAESGSVFSNAGRAQAIRNAFTDANGGLLSRAERAGLKFTIRRVEQEGYRLGGAIKYNGNEGIDLWFSGAGGRYALAEAKAGYGLNSLATDAGGVRQGSLEFFESRLDRAASRGIANAESLLNALRDGNVNLYGGFYGSQRLYQFKPAGFARNANFARNADAARLVGP